MLYYLKGDDKLSKSENKFLYAQEFSLFIS